GGFGRAAARPPALRRQEAGARPLRRGGGRRPLGPGAVHGRRPPRPDAARPRVRAGPRRLARGPRAAASGARGAGLLERGLTFVCSVGDLVRGGRAWHGLAADSLRFVPFVTIRSIRYVPRGQAAPGTKRNESVACQA